MGTVRSVNASLIEKKGILHREYPKSAFAVRRTILRSPELEPDKDRAKCNAFCANCNALLIFI